MKGATPRWWSYGVSGSSWGLHACSLDKAHTSVAAVWFTMAFSVRLARRRS